jgi:hypothetical protein
MYVSAHYKCDRKGCDKTTIDKDRFYDDPNWIRVILNLKNTYLPHLYDRGTQSYDRGTQSFDFCSSTCLVDALLLLEHNRSERIEPTELKKE